MPFMTARSCVIFRHRSERGVGPGRHEPAEIAPSAGKQALAQVIFEQINAHLAERGIQMREGTILDAIIIAAPPSTKKQARAQDPEMHQAKKGNE